MQSGTKDHGLDRTALVDLVREMHSKEGKHLSGPVELHRPSPPQRMVPSSPGVQCHVQGVQSSLRGLNLFATGVKHESFFMCLQFRIPWHGSKRLFNIPGMISVPLHLPPLLF